jgi:CTP synthase
VTNEIKGVIRKLAEAGVDVVITEIGGTVGDIESQPFLEAIRQFSIDVGKRNCLYIHLTLLPYLRPAGELKTKPTQHSVGQLREIGIQPDILICRTERSIGREEREKISLFCNVPIEAVIEEKDKDFSIYEVPLSLVDNRLDQLIVDQLDLAAGDLNLDDWREMVHRLRNPVHEISIAVVGKYAAHRDAYKSIYEALDHAGIAHQTRVRVQRIQSEDVEREGAERLLSSFDGLLVPGGFGERGIEGKVEAIRFARERGIPFFGICLGMQCAVIEFARHVAGLSGAHSTEFDKDTDYPVICLLDEQKAITDKGGTMRLGAQPNRLDSRSRAYACYGTETVLERHRHRYELNNGYRQQLEAHGLLLAGTSPDGSLVEVVEIPALPWFVAVQYHPEFKSKPTAAHPLFAGFVAAGVRHHTGGAETVDSATPQVAEEC